MIGTSFSTPSLKNTRRTRRKTEQSLQRRARLTARSKLEHLAQKHERRDDDRSIEIGLHDAVHAEPVRKELGPQDADCAVSVGGADAETQSA